MQRLVFYLVLIIFSSCKIEEKIAYDDLTLNFPEEIDFASLSKPFETSDSTFAVFDKSKRIIYQFKLDNTITFFKKTDLAVIPEYIECLNFYFIDTDDFILTSIDSIYIVENGEFIFKYDLSINDSIYISLNLNDNRVKPIKISETNYVFPVNSDDRFYGFLLIDIYNNYKKIVHLSLSKIGVIYDLGPLWYYLSMDYSLYDKFYYLLFALDNKIYKIDSNFVLIDTIMIQPEIDYSKLYKLPNQLPERKYTVFFRDTERFVNVRYNKFTNQLLYFYLHPAEEKNQKRNLSLLKLDLENKTLNNTIEFDYKTHSFDLIILKKGILVKKHIDKPKTNEQKIKELDFTFIKH